MTTNRRVALAILAMLGACGSVGDHAGPDAGRADARGADSSSVIDAASPPCDVTSPFGAPELVAGINSTATDIWGWPAADQRTIYFSRAALNSYDYNLYVATRAQLTDPFTNVMPLANVNTTSIDASPAVTADGLTLFAETTVAGNYDIYVATRSSTAADFSALSPVAGVNTSAQEGNPWISDDGLTMYFTSTASGSINGSYDIWRTTRASSTSPFNTPGPVGELNGTMTDQAPVLSHDGLEIFFASSRNGHLELFHATRSTPTDGFGGVERVTELEGVTNAQGGATSQAPNWLSNDRCELIFESDRAGGEGDFDVWIARRP
jgi:Tol biopolymer transport system component